MCPIAPSGRWITAVASVLHPRALFPHRPCDRVSGPIDGGVMGAGSVSGEGCWSGRKLMRYRVGWWEEVTEMDPYSVLVPMAIIR
jgi:hypothetical protein